MLNYFLLSQPNVLLLAVIWPKNLKSTVIHLWGIKSMRQIEFGAVSAMSQIFFLTVIYS